MYKLILDALYNLNGLKNAEERALFLQSLKPVAIRLRSAFNPYKSPTVRVNYRSRATQSAYMLRYFPQYSQVIRIILNRLKNANISLPFDQEELSACFFGAGPAPEVYGFLQFLNVSFSRVQRVNAYTFDIISEEWSYSRNITADYLVPSIWQNRKIELLSKNFDLTQTNSLNQFADVIGSSKLIVFQNCLNELNQNSYPTVIENFESLVRMMPADSVLMIIDLSSYPAALRLISQIEDAIKKSGLASILISLSEEQQRYDALAFIKNLPEIITQNLLTGEDGLIPRRNVKYHCLAIRAVFS